MDSRGSRFIRVAVPGESGIGDATRLPRRSARRAHAHGRRLSWRRRRRWWLPLLLVVLGASALAQRVVPWGHAAAAPPAGPPPLGVYAHPDAALTAFGALPALAPGVLARQLSSVDPAERNNDGAPANILYKTTHGTSVIFDATGPGVVEDIWVTAPSLQAMGNIHVRVDGRLAVDMPATAFFSGRVAPFLAPLVGDAAVSSGGNYSYVPIAFQRSCVIAFTGTTAYWHVGFHRLPPGTAVRPFSASANLRTAAAIWATAGQDPHRTAGTQRLSGSVSVPAGGRVTLARLSGPGRIESLRLTVPQAAVPAPPVLTRSGEAFTGSSTFTLRVNPANAGVRLVRRLDYALPDQTAAVYVDGVAAGTFSSPGSTNGPYFWRNASVTLPARLTAGRSHIRVTVAAAGPFTAFTYWAYSLVGGQPLETDALEMTTASEQAHGFSARGVLWQRSLTASYLPPTVATSRAVLDQLAIHIRFDGQPAPAVDAPLGIFFGAGAFGAAPVHSLMTAVDPATGALAAYWPMPFARSATVTLVNRGPRALPAVAYAIRFRPDPVDAAALAAGTEGYFHATYNREAPTTPGHDYVMLAATGTGKLVGVALSMSTPPGQPYGLENLQGNEQITVDGNPTPAYLGTGTEDFFQGGWYFAYGPFTLPTHGSPAQWVGPRYAVHIAAYRLFLSDAIPFYSRIHAGIQVGPVNNLAADYSSVAFWYGLPAPTLVVNDSLQPAEPASAAAHAYTATGGTLTGAVTSVFQGRRNGQPVTASGVTAATAAFTLRVDPRNEGVLLRAQWDQCPGHQAAAVVVDGVSVGVWTDPGSNCSERWKESSFLLPAPLTSGHTVLHLRLTALPGPVPAAGAPTWTAFGYEALSFVVPTDARPA